MISSTVTNSAAVQASIVQPGSTATLRASGKRAAMIGPIYGTKRSNIAKMFVDLLVKGTPLDVTIDLEAKCFDEAKMSELRRLAIEEARAERKAAKEAKQATQKGT